MPPDEACAKPGPSSPEVTRAICLVPSTPFSQAPWYIQPTHLCRFRVRPIRWGYFLEDLLRPRNPITANELPSPSTPSRPRNINLVSIDYAFRPRLRDRLTLSRRTLLRKPRTISGGDSHPSFVTHAGIFSSVSSTRSHDRASAYDRMLHYRVTRSDTRSFGTRL